MYFIMYNQAKSKVSANNFTKLRLYSNGKPFSLTDACVNKLVCGEGPAGVIVGVYSPPSGGCEKLTPTGEHLDAGLGGKLSQWLTNTSPFPRLGESRLFHGLHPIYKSIACVGLGQECQSYSVREQLDEHKESIRVAAGAGVRAFDGLDVSRLLIDSFGNAESAAEGSSLATWLYQEFRSQCKRVKTRKLELLDSCDFSGWQIGLHKAAAQNLARHLQEVPSNNLTPQAFSQCAIKLLSKHNINVEVRMRHWAELRNFNAFLAVSKGDCDPIFLELFYEGCDPDVCPVVLVGKGVTGNTGGLCLKTCKGMKHTRGDMAGAAVVVATMRAVAALQLPINVRGLIPLCSNVFGARSMKPGDTVKAHNGKTIRIDCTNCEGLLMHADALSYAGDYRPKFILDIGTMTSDSYAAMGQAGAVCCSNNDKLFEMMRVASIHTGDRVWRFPLWHYFDSYMYSNTSDLKNKTPKLIGGGPCKAAAFLRQFIPPGTDWIHVDMQNVFMTDGTDYTYLRPGMSGRPTRNIIEFLAQLACNHCK